jgi:hypothetical protein
VEADVIETDGCLCCPFRSPDPACMLATMPGRGSKYALRIGHDIPPSWCPLRKRPVLVRLVPGPKGVHGT